MHDFKNLSEIEIITYAMQGLCDFILKAPDSDLYRLNLQYTELHQRREQIDSTYTTIKREFEAKKSAERF